MYTQINKKYILLIKYKINYVIEYNNLYFSNIFNTLVPVLVKNAQ